MNPDAERIRMALADQVGLEALYLCGPFDDRGEPASPDIHILAVTKGHGLKDLHYLPGISSFPRRVEVSVVAAGDIVETLCDGVKNWPMFYTVDKVRRGKPLDESADMRDLRRRAIRDLRIRPSFYSAILKSISHSLQTVKRSDLRKEPLALSATMLIISVLSLAAVAKARVSFSKHSDMLEANAGLLREAFGGTPAAAAERCMACTRRVLGAVVCRFDMEADRFLKHVPGSTEGGQV